MFKLIYFPFTIRTAPQCQAPSPQGITLCHQVSQLSYYRTVAALLRDVSRCFAAACSVPHQLHCLDKRSSHHSVLELQTYPRGQGKIHTSGGQGGWKTTQASICSSPPVPCPQQRARKRKIREDIQSIQITNILSFKYKTQLEIIFRFYPLKGCGTVIPHLSNTTLLYLHPSRMVCKDCLALAMSPFST